tara:strand:- start:788 stop:1303 length:516 start_codon:yes stop_codon:yes gene_type:complete
MLGLNNIIQPTQQKPALPTQQLGVLSSLIPFDRFYKEAVSAIHGLENSDQFKLDKKKRLTAVSEPSPHLLQEGGKVAQIPAGVNQQALQAVPNQVNATPMQLFFDKTVSVLQRVSQREFRMNDLMEGFVEGRVSEDEVIIETAKLNLEMSMLVSIIQTSIQEFKGIQQIAV